MNWCDGELLVPKKCCFCIPLRIGLLVMGYIKLAITAILLVPFYIIVILILLNDLLRCKEAFVVTLFIQISILLIILTVDLLFTIIFIISVHSKKIKLIRFYYRYTIVMLITCTLIVVIFIGLDIYYNMSDSETFIKILCIIAYGCINFILQAYLILVMRSEMIKIRTNCKFRFVNDDAGAECVLESDAEIRKKVEDEEES